MSTLKYFMVLVAAVVMFNSCVNKKDAPENGTPETLTKQTMDAKINKSYGSYIAGRVAHLRKDFNSAANYYMQALEVDPNNPELIGRVYLILTSKGRIAEAAEYAEISQKKGDKNNFISIILAVDKMKKGQYQEANNIIKRVDGVIYQEFITPLMSSWAYVGEGNEKNAIKALAPLAKEPSFKALYNFHAGMIYDYFGNNELAKKHYEVIVNEESLEMSFRALQIITNLYVRTGEKEKAVALITKYTDDKALFDMMNNLKNNINKQTPQKTKKLINDPNIGVSEALFNIAATLRQGTTGLDMAHMFISLSIYENPKYDLAQLLLADILETREMYSEANDVYDKIDKSSEAYYTAQLKKANNFVVMEDYQGAELLMKSLALEKNSYQLYLDLGDVLRISGKQKEAIKYYEEAVKNLPQTDNQHWALFYALGISYEQNGQWDKAEKAFTKALELSQNHYMVLNYLGYSWLKEGKNTDQAFSMLAEAYNQAPNDGNIADSMGWAFYRLGMYDKAVEYLEKASELEPANPEISDHLGDAYWLGGRHNEARFQWKHAIAMEDKTGELKIDDIKKKIANGGIKNKPLTYDYELVKEKIDTLNNGEAQ